MTIMWKIPSCEDLLTNSRTTSISLSFLANTFHSGLTPICLDTLAHVDVEHLMPVDWIKMHMCLIDHPFNALQDSRDFGSLRPSDVRVDTIISENTLESRCVPLRRSHGGRSCPDLIYYNMFSMDFISKVETRTYPSHS